MDYEEHVIPSSHETGISGVNPQSMTPPEIADEYEIKSELGAGNQGKVFLAVRKSDGVKVAVKQLLIDSVTTWKAYELFEREAQTLQSIKMDGVARCYGVRECLGAKPPAVYLFQEFIEGDSLEKMLDSGHRFSIKAIFEIAIQLTEILKRLHSHVPPIIHRDIKPSNVMLYQSGADYYRATLIDFGAVANPQIQSGGSTVAGTYGYMPPEQLMGKPSPESDFYALGMLIVRMLSGVEPVDMPVSDFRPVIEPYLEKWPDCVVSVLRKMIEPAVMDRLADPDVLIPIFKNYTQDQFPPADVKTHNNKKAFEQKLLAVKSFGQNGNFSLWQQLSEKTPREIPKCYTNIHKKNKMSTTTLVEVKKESINEMVVTGFIVIMMWILICISFVSDIIHGMIVRWEQYIAFFVPMLFLSGMLYFIFRSPKNHNKKKLSLKYMDDTLKKDKMDGTLIDVLLKYGRKTIAIVSSIEYEPVSQVFVECFQTDQNESYLYNHGVPTFVVSYKFNPPDDADPDPLTHTIRIHFSPEGRIKPGDPLPILYYIDPDDCAYVVSMPFPYPLDDIVFFKEIYYRSFSRPEPVENQKENEET